MSSSRVAIVTGSAQGIGRAIALRLADDGIDIVVNDISMKNQELDALVAEIRAKNRRAISVTGDVSREIEVQNLVNTAVSEFGRLDVMVANAGIVHFGPIIETSVEEWDRVQTVNSRSTFLCYKAAAIQMIKQGQGGRIIGAASIAGKRGVAEWGLYCASKFSVRGLTQSTALELRKHGITVNTYCPGAVDTPMWEQIKESQAQGSNKAVVANYPKEMLVTPEAVAGLVSYLVRDEAKYITGQSMSVNMGAYCD